MSYEAGQSVLVQLHAILFEGKLHVGDIHVDLALLSYWRLLKRVCSRNLEVGLEWLFLFETIN